MALHTQESLSGFIASDPQLTYTERGDAIRVISMRRARDNERRAHQALLG